MSRRIYQDESFLYDNEAPTFGRAPTEKINSKEEKENRKKISFLQLQSVKMAYFMNQYYKKRHLMMNHSRGSYFT
jgi:hypothetical protein